MPSRTAAFPIGDLPGSLPTTSIPEDIDHAEVASSCLQYLTSPKPELFVGDALWRDLLAMTRAYRTFCGSESISEAWTEVSSLRRPAAFRIVPKSSRVVRFGPKICFIAARFTFTTESRPTTRSSGIIRLVLGPYGKWKIWVLITILEEVEGFGNPDVLDVCAKVSNGVSDLSLGSRSNGSTEINGLVPGGNSSAAVHLDCLVVGGGMAGLSLAGRLKALGVSAVTLERNAQVGMNWTNRYDSVKLHTAKEYGHLPFGRTFSPEDPYFLSAKDLARGFQRYVDQYDINIWGSTTVDSATWNDETKTWTANVNQKGQRMSITARHIVFATGPGGQIPKMPEYQHREDFSGTVMHSVSYKSSHAWRGKRGIVIGTGNTAHDVAEDMQLAGLSSVTMVQRNPTAILPIAWYRHFFDPLYNATSDTEISDRESLSLPSAISHLQARAGVRALSSTYAEHFDGLERVGFKTDRLPELYHIIYERQGGHYLDVGVSQKIEDGLIKVKSDAAVSHYTQTGLAFSDGSELEADVVVFCTGFEGNLRLMVAEIVGEEVAEQLEDFWCLDKEGEIRGAWKPIGHPGIWYTGGSIGLARYMSRFLAMQIKADVEGVPFEPYTKTPGQPEVVRNGSSH